MKKNYKKELADLKEELTVIYSALHKAEDKAEELTDLTDSLNAAWSESARRCLSLEDKLLEVRSVLQTLSERHVGFTFNNWTLLICIMPRPLVDWIKKFRLSARSFYTKRVGDDFDLSNPTRAPSAYLEEGSCPPVAEDV